MLAVLRQRNFSLLWFGGVLSVVGDFFLFIALPFFVYERTGSALATGAMFAAETLPRLLFGSVAGVFVDRWDRKKTMVFADVSRAVILLRFWRWRWAGRCGWSTSWPSWRLPFPCSSCRLKTRSSRTWSPSGILRRPTP